MKKVFEISFALLFTALFISTLNFNPSEIYNGGKNLIAKNFTASVFFADSVTENSLKQTHKEIKKNGPRVRILIVPGHDKEFGGTEFNGLKEVDLNLELGEELHRLLLKKSLFDVYISQTKSGYDSQFLSYFENYRDPILKFIDEHKGRMDNFISTGEIKRVTGVIHNKAPSEMALRLYGINKWANENGMNIIIHIHFNDYPGRKKVSPGKYSGFTIYVPEAQYSNAKGSKSVAESIHKRLRTLYAESDLPKEDQGIVEDQELIALGSHNTLDGAGMLIEYGYIYEPALNNPDSRSVIIKDLALQTYLGIMDFFGEEVDEGGTYDTHLLPHEWQNDLEVGLKENRGSKAIKLDTLSLDTLSLQAALVLEAVYPPEGESRNNCGLTGHFGPCTKKSVEAFQKKHGIFPAEGYVGEKTREKLNELY